MVQSLGEKYFSTFLDGGEDPRLSILVAVGSLSEIDFVGGWVEVVFCSEGEDGVGWDV